MNVWIEGVLLIIVGKKNEVNLVGIDVKKNEVNFFIQIWIMLIVSVVSFTRISY